MIETTRVDIGYMAAPERQERSRQQSREITRALDAFIQGKSHPWWLELPEEAPDDSEEGTLP